MVKRLIAALAVFAGLFFTGCATQNQHWETNCKVTGKDMLYDHDNGTTSRTKRLSTSCGVFNVDDAWEAGSFSSYELWAKLEEGKTYDLKVGGVRSGAFSMFQTVLQVKGPN